MTVRDNSEEMTITAAEAFLLKLSSQGLKGDAAAARLAGAVIETASAKRGEIRRQTVESITRVVVAPGSVNTAIEPLRMAKKLDRYRETARILLEPWIIEKALARLGARRLCLDDQKAVLDATRTPKKVRWPDWWQALP